ncbi:hypothetical protein BGW39_003083, partial [Mortierella sp. 14UC]
ATPKPKPKSKPKPKPKPKPTPFPPPTFPNRENATITHSEYCVLRKIYLALLEAPPEVVKWFDELGKNSRKYDASRSLSIITGVSIVYRTSRPHKERDDTLMAVIHAMVEETNKKGAANSLNIIRNRLQQEHNIKVSKRTVNRVIHKLNCYWGTGVRRNILHSTPQNIAYCMKYLERRLSNLEPHINKKDEQIWILKFPEVFLDESYCHLDHTASARWIIPGVPVSEPGHSPLLVIFAAFVVWYDREEDKLRASFVNESVYIWPLIGLTHTKDKATAKTLHDKTLWNDVPQLVRDAGIIAPSMDYYGNFTSKLFDGLFARICQNLQKMGLEKCRIHLDGASYHFHKTAAKPKTKLTCPI